MKTNTIMDSDYEPMDIDLSSHSVSAMDISYNDSNHIEHTIPLIKIKEEPADDNYVDCKERIDDEEIIQAPTIIKRFSLKIPTRKEKMPFVSNFALSVIISTLALLSLLAYQVMNFDCSKELDLNALKQSLSNNLFGQSQAIEDIIESLEDKSKSKILVFYGGTGVGKTLTVSLILENLYHYANVYHYTMPSFVDTFSTDLMLGLTMCPASMIVVDDLNKTDMYVKEHIRKFIDKSENLNKNITIILVFNCDTINDQYVKKCDYSFYTELKAAFKEINASKKFIKFNSLTEEHLRRCIQKELGTKILSEEVYNDIIKNFNVSVDGCKGVYTKIKLLNL
ncbi:torsin-2A [Epargyreus clarus]|uniref:torsin-2A n=1 Tax=Epargyreus clarus TaxID=520877 RepID=UPI003C2C601F